MGRKNKFVPLPVDDPTHPNTTPFRVFERAFKRKQNTKEAYTHILEPESSNLPDLPDSILSRFIDPLNYLSKDPVESDPPLPPSAVPKLIQIPQLDPRLFPRAEEGSNGGGAGDEGSPTIPALLFPTHPGLIYIPKAISPETQKTMVKKCLREWTCRPNVTNLDTHYVIEEAKGLWSVYEREWKMRQQGGSLMDTVVERRVGLGGMEAYTDDEEEDPGQVVVKSEKEGIAKKVKTERVVASCGSCATPKTTVGSNLKTLMKSGCGNAKDKEEVVVDVDAFKSAAANAAPVVGDSIPIVPEKIDPPTTVTPLLQPLPVSALIKKWRWSSLGWQYNWTKKKYHMDRPVQFPPELDEMTRAVIGSVEELTGYSKKEYKSEAGIVNFYQMSDALMGHQDRSEVNMDAPLVSFSLGHSCIIVIGTESREDRDPLPISFVLRSGDIIVMSGPSRKVFHGVPRILSNSLPAHLSRNQNDDDKDWPVFASFLSTTRININVRQII